MDRQLLLGNEAVARGAYEAGARVATAYPGTPSTEITENAVKYGEIYCEWSPNEKVALEVALGASVAGARAMCSMKHVGLNVAADPLFTAAYTGVNGGLVIVVADDPGMHSSQNEQDTRYYGLSAKIPVLEPSDSGECLRFVKEAFQISEEFDTPVIVRLTTRVAHSRSLVEVGDRIERALLEYKKDAGKYVMMPAMARARHVIVEARMAALGGFAETTDLNRVIYAADGARVSTTPCADGAPASATPCADGTPEAEARTCADGTPEAEARTCVRRARAGIVTSGISWQFVREALESLGLAPGADVPVLLLGLVHPLPERLVSDFLSRVDTALIAEELSPFIENTIKAYGLKTRVIGKTVLPAVGELSAALIKNALSGILAEGADCIAAKTVAAAPGAEPEATVPAPDLPVRPPVMCPGCPHRSVFFVLKKLRLIVCGDIGCYTLGALPPLRAIDTCVCMGASVGMAHGMDKARGGEFSGKTVAVIGDSTFIHSGITGLIDVVYNKGNSTVLILDNGITAMTGRQDNPATGRAIGGDETFKVDLAGLCAAVGVERIRVEDPFDVVALEKAVKEEMAHQGPSVIIVRRPCAMIGEYRPGEPVYIDREKCTGCRMCMGISCAAISEKGGKMRINPALCARCGLCATICRFGAIKNAAGGKPGAGEPEVK